MNKTESTTSTNFNFFDNLLSGNLPFVKVMAYDGGIPQPVKKFNEDFNSQFDLATRELLQQPEDERLRSLFERTLTSQCGTTITPQSWKKVHDSLKQQMSKEQYLQIRKASPGRVSFDLLREMNKEVQDHALLKLWENINRMYGREGSRIHLPQNASEMSAAQVRLWMEKNKEELRKIEEVRIIDGGLQVIPPEIRHLTQLGLLCISGNEIQVIPPEIEHLTQLEVLYIGRNPIQVIPPEIRHLTQLKEIYISSDQLQIIPREFLGRIKISGPFNPFG